MEILGQAKAANSLADNNEYTALNNDKDTLDQNFQGIEFACIHQIKVEKIIYTPASFSTQA